MSYRYCCNHDVLCGTYDCNMADVVNNSVMCKSKECMYNGGDYAKKHFIGLIIPTPYEDIAANLLANSLKDESFPF